MDWHPAHYRSQHKPDRDTQPMENPDPNDSNAINAYIDSLEKRISALQGMIDGFTISGPDISGSVDTGFNYSPGNEQEGQYQEQ